MITNDTTTLELTTELWNHEVELYGVLRNAGACEARAVGAVRDHVRALGFADDVAGMVADAARRATGRPGRLHFERRGGPDAFGLNWVAQAGDGLSAMLVPTDARSMHAHAWHVTIWHTGTAGQVASRAIEDTFTTAKDVAEFLLETARATIRALPTT